MTPAFQTVNSIVALFESSYQKMPELPKQRLTLCSDALEAVRFLRHANRDWWYHKVNKA